MSDVKSPVNPGGDKVLQAIADKNKAHDRVCDQPESAKGPVGIPMGAAPSPYRIKGGAGPVGG